MRHRADPSDAEPSADPGADLAPRRRLRLGVGAAVVLLLGAFVVAVLTPLLLQRGGDVPVPEGSGRGATSSASVPASAAASSYGPDAGELFVHVSGAVVTPGLVTLAAGARVVDAVAAAGGFTPEADPAGVNLARPLNDGEQLIVPRVGEVLPPASAVGGAATGAGTGRVNLNTAAAADLETLPRIGPALAQRIIDWREANGRFSSPDDLRKVAGIGDKVFDGLKDRVTV